VNSASFWLVIGIAGVGTMLMRVAPILAHGHVTTPAAMRRLLAYVPAAAMATLAVPGALFVKSGAAYEFTPARTVAAVAALLVALRWRNVVLTLVVGMGALWALQLLRIA
jgi:branched-subunit amino acid transport protein